MKELIGAVFAGAAMAVSAQVAAPGTVTPVPAGEIPAKKVAVFVQKPLQSAPSSQLSFQRLNV